MNNFKLKYSFCDLAKYKKTKKEKMNKKHKKPRYIPTANDKLVSNRFDVMCRVAYL